jgi:hypothetical protein
MSFAMQISEYANKQKGDINTVVRAASVDVGRRLIEKSPVGNPNNWDLKFVSAAKKLGWLHDGYVGGRFRGNWQYGDAAIPSGELPDIDPSGDVSNARIAASIGDTPAGKVNYIVNNLPYAQRLENGYSYQAPSGMVAVTVVEWQDIMKKAIAEVRAA